MKSIVIKGGLPLSGKISVSGSKNASLPILFSTILTEGVSRIEGLPRIGDVEVALDILTDLGATVSRRGEVTLIDTANLKYRAPKKENVSRIRASTYLIGSCLSRFGVCELADFGGCNFSARPIDMHIYAAEAMGAVLENRVMRARKLFGCEINFAKPSVGATVNAILLAVSAEGKTVIRGYAREPHIDSLIDFLISAGAVIERSASEIVIFGRRLCGGCCKIPGDMIEAGTYLSLGVISGGEIAVENCPEGEMYALKNTLKAFGAEVDQDSSTIVARRGEKMHFAELSAEPYPGFPTDLQPIAAVVAASFRGGIITDNVWCSRFGYLTELEKFGVRFWLKENSAFIGGTDFVPARAAAPDLRGGMACILSALMARGESVIESVDKVERGYESLAEKLKGVGADVEIVWNR